MLVNLASTTCRVGKAVRGETLEILEEVIFAVCVIRSTVSQVTVSGYIDVVQELFLGFYLREALAKRI